MGLRKRLLGLLVWSGSWGLTGCTTAWWVASPPTAIIEPLTILLDQEDNIVSEVKEGLVIHTFAGTGVPGFSGDGGPANQAQINNPHGLSFDREGNLYFADTDNHRIRKITPKGIISTVAGAGHANVENLNLSQNRQLLYRDGLPVTLAFLIHPEWVEVDANGDLFLVDQTGLVRHADAKTGLMTVAAGGGDVKSGTFKGAGTDYAFGSIHGLFLHPQEGLFISHSAGNQIWQLKNGNMAPFAGVKVGVRSGGFNEEEQDALRSLLNYPTGLTMDATGDVYFSDTANHIIRKVNRASGQISTVVGTPGSNNSSLSHPNGLAFDSKGNLYIADEGLNVIHRFGSDGKLTTFAGKSGQGGFNGDGRELGQANLNAPFDIAMDSSNRIFFSDRANHRIRYIAFERIF